MPSLPPNVTVPIFLALAVVVILLSYIYWRVWYKNFYFNFGSDKGEIREKVITESASYLYYNRIQNVSVGQGIVERLFGVYTIKIETAGEQSGKRLLLGEFDKENAEKFKNFLMEKSKNYRGGGL